MGFPPTSWYFLFLPREFNAREKGTDWQLTVEDGSFALLCSLPSLGAGMGVGRTPVWAGDSHPMDRLPPRAHQVQQLWLQALEYLSAHSVCVLPSSPVEEVTAERSICVSSSGLLWIQVLVIDNYPSFF